MSYAHTQRGGLHWLLWFTTGVMFIGAWGVLWEGEPAWAAWLLIGVGLLVALLALCFMSLTVRDVGDALEVRFGPISLFKTKLAYADISSAKPARSILIDGWGVHYIPGRGWTWNLWTFDCVELVVKGRTMRVGTDDKEALAKFLQARIGAASDAA